MSINFSLESERCREPSRGMDVTPSSVSSMSELEDLVGNIEVADRTVRQTPLLLLLGFCHSCLDVLV